MVAKEWDFVTAERLTQQRGGWQPIAMVTISAGWLDMPFSGFLESLSTTDPDRYIHLLYRPTHNFDCCYYNFSLVCIFLSLSIALSLSHLLSLFLFIYVSSKSD